MGTVDFVCKLVGACGGALLVLGLLYVCFIMAFLDNALPAPPKIMFIGLLLVFAAAISYAATHLIAGDLL